MSDLFVHKYLLNTSYGPKTVQEMSDKQIPTEGSLLNSSDIYRLHLRITLFGLFKSSTYFCTVLTLGSQENIWNSSISCETAIPLRSGKDIFRDPVTLR